MRFKPVRDPVTGRIDMIPVSRAEWGDKAESPSTSLALGHLRYKAALGMLEEGDLTGVADLHDATLAEITGLLAPHLEDDEVGALARRWIEISRLVRDGTLRMGTLCFQVTMAGNDTLVALNITNDDIVLTCFCTCHGNVVYPPIVYWNEQGAFSMTQVDDDQVDENMVDTKAQLRRSDLTHTAMVARQAADAQPEGVVDMKAWQTLRIVRGG